MVESGKLILFVISTNVFYVTLGVITQSHSRFILNPYFVNLYRKVNFMAIP